MDSLEEIKEMAAPNGVVLYTLDSKDRIRSWACWYAYRNDVPGIFYTDCILPDGKIKEPTFKASKEKNVGKVNYISPERQAELMLDMEVGKKLRSNYFYTTIEAVSNKLWLPMLAHKFNDYQSKISFPRYSQPKLDGARCNVYWSELENKVVAKTRTGKDYFTTGHIIEELRSLCEDNKNLIFDGELYNHDYKHDFEKIMSLARQTKPTKEDLEESSRLLQYHVYDVYFKNDPNTTFEDRTSWLRDCQCEYPNFRMIYFVPTDISNSQEEEDAWHGQYLEESYEGQMVRNPHSIYKVDGRSQDLLKRKLFVDAEFEIVDIVEGEAAWEGCAKNVIIKLSDGRVQGCGIDGSFEVNRERFNNKQELIGKLATVRYFRLTKDNFLYIPVCKDINRHDI